MPNFKIVANLLLGCTDSGGYVKLTSKYIDVGGEGGVSEFYKSFQSYSFGNSGPHAKFLKSQLTSFWAVLIQEDMLSSHQNIS